MFRGPSWDDLYRVPLRSPPASPPRRLAVGSRVARQEDHLFRRLFPAGPEKNPKALSNCLPAEIGPLVTCRALRAVADPQRRPGPPSRSPEHHARPFRVAEVKNLVGSLWITGI